LARIGCSGGSCLSAPYSEAGQKADQIPFFDVLTETTRARGEEKKTSATTFAFAPMFGAAAAGGSLCTAGTE
jgi:hypothetical protein